MDHRELSAWPGPGLGPGLGPNSSLPCWVGSAAGNQCVAAGLGDFPLDGAISNANATHFYMLNVIDDVLSVIVTPALCLFGCVGNAINLVVLTKIRLRMRKVDGGKEGVTHLGLMLLAVSDLLFCISACPRGFQQLASTTALFDKRGFALYYQVYGTAVVSTFLLTSTWITVAMATLRYVGICHPLTSRHVDSRLYGRVAYAIVTGISVLVNAPAFWQFKVEVLQLDIGRRLFLVDIGPLDAESLGGRAFLWVRAAYAVLVPAVVLAFCNLSLVRALRMSNRMRRAHHVQKSASRNSARITMLLVVLVLMFVLLVFPSELMSFFTAAVRLNAVRTQTFLALRSAANALQVLNFAVNFVLYCVLNVHFRFAARDLLLLCCCCFRCGRGRGRGHARRSLAADNNDARGRSSSLVTMRNMSRCSPSANTVTEPAVSIVRAVSSAQ